MHVLPIEPIQPPKNNLYNQMCCTTNSNHTNMDNTKVDSKLFEHILQEAIDRIERNIIK